MSREDPVWGGPQPLFFSHNINLIKGLCQFLCVGARALIECLKRQKGPGFTSFTPGTGRSRPQTQMNAVRFLDSNPGPRTVKGRDTPQTTLRRSCPQSNWQQFE